MTIYVTKLECDSVNCIAIDENKAQLYSFVHYKMLYINRMLTILVSWTNLISWRVRRTNCAFLAIDGCAVNELAMGHK